MSNNTFVSFTRTSLAAAFAFGMILASASSAAANPKPVGLGDADDDTRLLAVVGLPSRVPAPVLPQCPYRPDLRTTPAPMVAPGADICAWDQKPSCQGPVYSLVIDYSGNTDMCVAISPTRT